VCLERLTPTSLCRWRLCKKVAQRVEETIGRPVRYVCLPAGTVLNSKTRGVNLFLRLEDESSHEMLVQALNIKFSNLGWNTWATYARSTVPFTGQPTWLAGDARCRCRRCEYEAVSYPDWEPHHPRRSDQLPANNTPASVPMNVHSSTHAPVAVAYSSIRRPNPLSDDEGEETLQLHPTEPLETDDLGDLVDLPPLEPMPPGRWIPAPHRKMRECDREWLREISGLRACEDTNSSQAEHLLDVPASATTSPTLALAQTTSPSHIQVTQAHTPATLALTLAASTATPAPRLTAPPATPSIPVTTPSTPTTVRAERGALRGITRWDTRHAPPQGSPVDAPPRIVHVIRGSNPRWLNATHRRDTRIVIREPPESRPYWPGRVMMPRASPNPSSHYD
jgi:hypothetical protein